MQFAPSPVRSFAQNFELKHCSHQATVQQLHNIREEIRQGTKILNPTRLTVSSGQKYVYQNGSEANPQNMPGDIPRDNNGRWNSTPLDEPGVGFAAQAIKQQQSRETEEAHRLGARMRIGKAVPIPISAVSAGMIEPRESGTYGSDILLDALLEEEVAQKANVFFAAGKENPDISSD